MLKSPQINIIFSLTLALLAKKRMVNFQPVVFKLWLVKGNSYFEYEIWRLQNSWNLPSQNLVQLAIEKRL